MSATDIAAPAATGSRLKRAWQRKPRGFLAFVMLLTGAAGLVYEYVLSTVFSYMVGGSIEQFSITISAMFVMMGMSGIVQPYLRGPLPVYFVCAELLLTVLGGFAPLVLQWSFANLQTDFAWIKILYPVLIGLLIGVEIPLAMRINEQFAHSLSGNIAGTWAWDYIGGALGVFWWLWMLRSFVPITHISLWTGALNLVVALMSAAFFWKKGLLRKFSERAFVLVAAAGAILALVVGAANIDVWSRIVNQKLYENPVVLHTRTAYQDIAITQGPHPTDPRQSSYDLFLNGNKQFSSADEHIYHEHLVHPAMYLAARHARVLVLGGGDGLAVRELLKYKDVESITLVDLDPGMIELARTNPILKQINGNSFGDARVHATVSPGVTDTGKKRDVYMGTGEVTKTACRPVVGQGGHIVTQCDSEPVTQKTASVDIYTIDANLFIARPSAPYDVVIVDLPDPNSVELARLYSQDFYAKVKQVMSPDGIVVVQATSPYFAKETFLCLMRTMAAAGLNVLPYHADVPSFGDWGWVIGSPTVRSETLYQRITQPVDYGVPTVELTPDSMRAAVVFGKSWLVTNDTRISTLMQPVIFELYTYEAWKVD